MLNLIACMYVCVYIYIFSEQKKCTICHLEVRTEHYHSLNLHPPHCHVFKDSDDLAMIYQDVFLCGHQEKVREPMSSTLLKIVIIFSFLGLMLQLLNTKKSMI